MFKTTVFLTALCCAVAMPAYADMYSHLGAVVDARGKGGMMPPEGYTAQRWRSPDNCDYSRAGRPGETVWYLIVNTAHIGCQTRIIERAYSDYR